MEMYAASAFKEMDEFIIINIIVATVKWSIFFFFKKSFLHLSEK